MTVLQTLSPRNLGSHLIEPQDGVMCVTARSKYTWTVYSLPRYRVTAVHTAWD